MQNLLLQKELDEIKDRLSSIDKTLALNTQSLQEHIKRTNILEQELQPIVKHVEQVKGVMRFLAWCAVVSAILLVFR